VQAQYAPAALGQGAVVFVQQSAAAQRDHAGRFGQHGAQFPGFAIAEDAFAGLEQLRDALTGALFDTLIHFVKGQVQAFGQLRAQGALARTGGTVQK
jgi:hypothetical protein